MERTKSIPQQQAWVNTHKKRIIKHLDQLIGKLIRERYRAHPEWHPQGSRSTSEI
jgi:hypothetical protein